MVAERGYCVKCRESVDMKEAKEITTKNGKKAMSGTCPTCGTTVFRFLKTNAKKVKV